ncbi:ABC transporter ATP-binding protein [Microbacterium paraoxydans]|uniref:ABC transporter ATP-binding protein n=1 Tax=Microbacterium paraoxydans TaxID=199592 RepID=A0ABS5IIP6_9MICO|nr:ABC transporter ATP-binding protein [Microbacterium paraoxydans]
MRCEADVTGIDGRPALQGDSLVLGYGRSRVVHDVSLRLAPGRVTALIGPNGSGKSTVLRALARLHRIDGGTVRVGGEELRDAAALSAKEFAQTVAMLSQSRPHPSGIEVSDVVAYGRHPHRGRFAGVTEADRAAVARALELTGLSGMAGRPVDQLSGGELQRVWLATALAQDTGVLLLDEPTNHLDLRYQVETLDLVRELADEHGTALGVVLHDLDHAASVADDVVLLHRGRVHAAGTPAEVLTGENLSAVYGLRIDTAIDEETGLVRVRPRGRHHARHRAGSAS